MEFNDSNDIVEARRALDTPLVKHSSSFIPVKVLPSPLGAMVLYCYHTATYYSANFDRVADLIKTDLYFKTRHFILFYSLKCLHGIVSPYIIGVTVIICSCCSTGADWQDNMLIDHLPVPKINSPGGADTASGEYTLLRSVA